MQELDAAGAERARAIYDYGSTAIIAYSRDPRLHLTMYVPPAVAEGRKVNLVVAVHGTGRTSALEFRDGLAEFGLWHNCAILCPIFPVGIFGDGARSGYKYFQERDIRYDLALIGMVEEMAGTYGQDWSRFAIFGYSGGGHFSHRFALLHPELLWAASIGAPGSVTLLDPERDWWAGVRDMESRFGKALNLDELRTLPVHMVVGDADLETWEITHHAGGRYWVEGANDAGRTRPERLESLAKSFRDNGIDVTMDVVKGVSHDRQKCLPLVKEFLSRTLKKRKTT